MATVSNQYDPNQQNQDQQQNTQQSGSPVQTNTGTSGAAYSQAQNQANPQNSSSGRFTNLNSYLNANKNYNAQNGGFAGQVAGDVQNQGKQYQQTLADQYQNFQNQADQGRSQYDQGYVNQALTNPSQFVQDPNNVNKFNSYLNAQYNGPKQFNTTPELQNQIQNYQQLAGQVGTEQGRYNLLNQLYNKPEYTQGQQTLDQLFLQSNPDQINQLQNARTYANQLGNQTQQFGQQAQALVQNYGNEAANTAQQTGNALNQSVLNYAGSDPNSVLNQKIAQATTQRSTDVANLLSAIQSGNITSSQALQLGLTPQELAAGGGSASGINTYGVSASPYLSTSNFTPTMSNVANNDDYARMQALGQLEGQHAQGDVSKILSQFADKSQAGTFSQQPEQNFDVAGYLNAIRNQQNNYQGMVNPQQQAIQQAQAALSGGDKNLGAINTLLGSQGIQGQVNASADAIKNYLNQQNSDYQGMGMQPQYQNVNQLTPDQLLQQYGNVNNNSFYNLAGNKDLSWLLGQEQSEKAKQSAAQQALQNLYGQYNAGQTLNITSPQVSGSPLTKI